LLLALEAEGVELEVNDGLDAYIVALGDEAKLKAVELISSFRLKGISADMDYMMRKMKAQMKSADRLQAKFVVIIGEEELEEGIVVVKHMETGNQEKVQINEIVNFLKQQLS